MSEKLCGSALARRHAAAIVDEVMRAGRALKPEIRQAYVLEEMAHHIDLVIEACYEPPPGSGKSEKGR
jgi:hypothetical protein